MRDKLKTIVFPIVIAAVIAAYPACPAYAADAENWASLEGWLSDINSKLGWIYYDAHDIYNSIVAEQSLDGTKRYLLGYIHDTATACQNVYSKITLVESEMNTALSRMSTTNTSLSNIYQKLSDLYDRIGTLFYAQNQVLDTPYDLLVDILSDLDAISQNGGSGSVTDYSTVLSNIYSRLGTINSSIASITIPNYANTLSTINGNILGVIDAIDDISVPGTDMSTTNWWLEQIDDNINDVIYGIERMIEALQNMVVPSSNGTTEIIGQFNTQQFDDNVKDLITNISEVAPFGAISLISSFINVLSSIAPPQDPVLYFDFDFFGHEQIAIDLSWLDDIKPAINFACIFFLMLGLAFISAKYVRNEAST